MKMTGKILVATAVVLALGGGYAYLTLAKPFEAKSPELAGPPPAPAPELPHLVKLDGEKLSRVTIKRVDSSPLIFERFTEKESQSYRLVGREDIELDQSKVAELFDNASSVWPQELVAEQAEQLADYGLDKPVVIQAQEVDGTSHGLEIGAATSAGNYYVRKPGEKAVYLIGSYSAGAMVADLFQFRHKLLPAVDPQSLVSIRFNTPKTTIELINTQAANQEAFIPTWQITKPFRHRYPASTDRLKKLMDQLPKGPLEVKSFVDKPGSLENYGLDKPLNISLQDTVGSLDLLVGNEADKETVYAKLADKPVIFTLSKSDVAFAQKLEPFSFVFTLPLLVDITKVEQLVFQAEGKTMTFGLQRTTLPKAKDAKPEDPAEVQTTYTFNGKPLAEEVAKKVYQRIIGLALEGASPQPVPVTNAKVEVSLIFTMSGLEPKKVFRFVSANSDYYGLVLDNDAEFLISKTQVRQAVAALTQLVSSP